MPGFALGHVLLPVEVRLALVYCLEIALCIPLGQADAYVIVHTDELVSKFIRCCQEPLVCVKSKPYCTSQQPVSICEGPVLPAMFEAHVD